MKQIAARLKLWLTSQLSRLSRYAIGKHVRALVVESGDFMFAVDPEDLVVGRHLRSHGSYGEDEVRRIARFIDDQSTVVIAGTHVGSIAIPVAARCKKVIAFEANPNTYELLRMNIAINQITNLTAHNLAVSNRECELKFLMNRANSGGSKIVPQNKTFNYYYDSPQEVTVRGVQGDRLIDADSIDLMVMDIEGSEYFALQGMQQTLAKTKTLIVEFVPHHLKDVSGVSVQEFLSMMRGFRRLTIPSLGLTINGERFLPTLQKMFDDNQHDDGLVFER